MDHPLLKPLDIFRRVDRNVYTDPTMPEYPGRVLVVHCLWKGLEFSVLGFPLTPLLALTRGLSLGAAAQRAFLLTPAFGLVGTGALLGYKAAFDMDVAGVDDRAFRIAKSQGQTRVDSLAAQGALTGAAVGAVLMQRGFTGVLTAASAGVGAAVLLHAAPMVVEEAERRGVAVPEGLRGLLALPPAKLE